VSTLLAVGFVSSAHAESANGVADVVSVGPLELIETNSVTVLGRSYHVDDAAGLTTGDKVAVHGDLQPDGSVSNAWVESVGTYVAGSDSVFETGVVTNVNETFGRLSIGDSKIDYTAALSEAGSSVPNKGEIISVTGIQPETGGVVMGTTTRAGTTEVVMAIAAGGTRGLAGITGSNSATKGITGSNSATKGITGSNSATKGITGSNSATKGITGSNGAAKGITGSNSATKGITGSNSATKGITGSNSATKGITGSNGATK
jgi:hypothetical protein